jgi:mersacidin/lichenicidin family type 2 lantibiotic
MNFDIARAWKDESYCQELSDEQLSSLPANPAGELTSAELEAVYGSQGPASSASSSFAAERDSFHSIAVFCQEELFSVNINPVPNFLAAVNNICVNIN